jgi:hypothetical protein
MGELKITPIVPDEDESSSREPRRRRTTAPVVRPKRPSDPRVVNEDANGDVKSPEEPDFDPQAVEDEVKRRYGLDKVKVTEVPRSRSGAKFHRTGISRK